MPSWRVRLMRKLCSLLNHPRVIDDEKQVVANVFEFEFRCSCGAVKGSGRGFGCPRFVRKGRS